MGGRGGRGGRGYGRTAYHSSGGSIDESGAYYGGGGGLCDPSSGQDIKAITMNVETGHMPVMVGSMLKWRGRLRCSGSHLEVAAHLRHFKLLPGAGLAQSVAIGMVGSKVDQPGQGCAVATVLCGSLFILPLCFMCCDWWKRLNAATYAVPVSSYQALWEVFAHAPQLNTLSLELIDGKLGAEKLDMLADLISRSNVTSVNIVNYAAPLTDEYSAFASHARRLKGLNKSVNLQWATTVV